MARYNVVMVRHGESIWNEKNLFCGWFDADLNEKEEAQKKKENSFGGLQVKNFETWFQQKKVAWHTLRKEEALRAGEALKEANYKFDCAHTSVLTRAKRSLETILGVLGQTNIPVYESWRLNERHYGGLTGLNKSETAIKYGETQVQIWRRSYDVPPPIMETSHPYYSEIVNDPRYAKGPAKEEFPMSESLKLTIERTMPYWNNVIVPQLKEGKTVLVVAHGNSLRGIVKTLENLSDNLIMQLNLPTGIPFVYTLDEDLKPLASMRFLGDEETVKRAMESVAAQGKAK